MVWALSLYTLPLYLTVALAVSILLYSLRYRKSTGVLPLAALMASFIVWSCAYALELSSQAIAAQIFLRKIALLAALIIPPAFLLLSIRLIHPQRRSSQQTRVLLSIEPILVLILVLTNGFHQLIFAAFRQIQVGSLYHLDITFGAGFWFHLLYSYSLIVVSAVILLRGFVKNAPENVSNIIVASLSLLVLVVFNLISLLGLSPVRSLDLTPYSFLIIDLAVIWRLVRTHFPENGANKSSQEYSWLGLERFYQLVENTPNPIFAVDRAGAIRAWNPACENIFLYGREIVGQKYHLLLPEKEQPVIDVMLAEVFENGRSYENLDIEIRRKDGAPRFMASRLYPLLDQQGNTEVCVIANTDITDRAQSQESLRRQYEELRVLHAVAIACAEANNEDALIKAVTKVIGGAFFPDNFGVLLVDEKREIIYRHPSYQDQAEVTADIMPIGVGISGKVIREARPMLVPDISLEPAYFEADPRTRSELCVPLKTIEHAIGAFNTESQRVGAFDESDERLLTILAGQLASTIERLRAEMAERQRVQELQAITRISREVSSLLDLHAVLNSIVRYAAEISNGDASGLFLQQPGGCLTLVASYGVGEAFVKMINEQGVSTEGSAVGRAIDLGQPYQIADIGADPAYAMKESAALEDIQAILAIPMQRGEETIGGIVVWYRQPHTFTREEERFIQAIANQSVNAVENARLFEAEREQRKLAEIMSETGTALSTLLDFDELMDSLLLQLERLVPYDAANVMLVDDHTAHVARALGYEKLGEEINARIRSLSLDIQTTGNLSEIVQTRRPVTIPDISQDPEWIWLTPDYPVRSCLAAPIIIGEQVAAIFSLEKLEPGFYQPEHAERLAHFAGQAGLAFQNARLFDAAHDQAQKMAELAIASQDLNRPLTVQEVVQGIGKGAMALGKADRAAIYLREPGDRASCRWYEGLSEAYIHQVIQKIQNVPGGQLLQSAEPILIPDVLQLPEEAVLRNLAVLEGYRGVGLWPLVYEGVVIAAIGIYHDEPYLWSNVQREILLAFTRQASIALQNASLFSETKRRATHQEALNKIIAEAVKAPNLVHLVETALDLTMKAIGADRGGLWVSGYTALRDIPEGLSRSDLQSERNQERESDNAFVVADCMEIGPQDPGYPWAVMMTAYDIRAFLVVPVMSGGLRVGGLALASCEPRIWLKDEITLAESVIVQVGSAAERLELLGKTQEQARQVQLIIDTVPDGVLLLDALHRIVLANPAARQYLAILLDQVDGTGPLTHLAGQPIQDLFDDASDGSWRDLQSARESPQVFEIAVRPLEVMTYNAGWVLVLRDVTDERASLARVQMQERLATVGQLAAGIAHDFNNIMAAIVVYTDLLTFDPSLSEKSKDQLKIIQQQIQRAISLIRQILDFSRRSVMEPSPLDLLPFIKELDKLLGRTLPENIFLRLSYQPGVYMVKADPTRLQQIFMNLALNSRDAMPLGGDLQFSLDRFYLPEGEKPPLPELPPGNWIRLTIRDTGVGIPEDILPHIFDPFYTTKPAGKGTGLGLAQVYGIVKQHGGSIDVESRLGEGTAFRLYFPELTVPEELAVIPEGASLLDGSGECVLIVEDDPTTREALQSLLESRNFNVLTAEDGVDALRLYEQGNPAIDLVISDVVMPGMGGVTLYYALRERGFDLKMLFITGHPLDRVSQNLLEESHVEWLLKPFSVQEFLKALQRMLASSS